MRVKGGNVAKNRRKKILKLAKGYYGSKHCLYKTAHEQVMRSLNYAYRDRRATKRDFRKLWITRINAAANQNNISYSKLMHGLKLANIDINRKMLSEIAIADAEGFKNLVEIAKKNDVGLIVLGHPINMNGTLGPRSEKVQAFGKHLEEISGIKVELFDERLSTANAHVILNQTNTRGQKRKDIIDEMSACLILQSYLDRERNKNS